MSNINGKYDLVDIENLIFTIRGVQILIDRDLAEIYKVETRILNQAVKRNIKRFPERFRFKLTDYDINCLKSQNQNSKSQIVTLNHSK